MSSLSLRSLKVSVHRTAEGCGLLLIALGCVAQSGFGAEPDCLAPPQYVGPPQPQHAVTNRAFQGIPSLAVSPGGRLWANWYAGKTPGEDQNNYVVLSTSGDNGATWREVLVVDPDGDGPLRTFDPELWMAPDGKLRVFWAQAQGHEATVGGVWCLETAEPESEQPAWEQARARHRRRDDVQAAGAHDRRVGVARLHLAEDRQQRQAGRFDRPGPDLDDPRRLQRARRGPRVRRTHVHRAQGRFAVAAGPHELRHRRKRVHRSRRDLARAEAVGHRASQRAVLHHAPEFRQPAAGQARPDRQADRTART